MEYRELQKATYKCLAKAAATGLVGLVLTIGAIKAIENPDNKATAGAAGLGLSCLAVYYQIFKSKKDYY